MPVSLSSMPSCLSFIVLSSVLLLKTLTSCFQDEICEMLFSVSQQQQINGITLAPQSHSFTSTLFPLFSNEILKTSLKSTFPPAYTKADSYTIRQDMRLVWRQLLQRFTLTDLYNLIIPWGWGQGANQWITWVFHNLFSDLKAPTSFFCTSLKTRYCFHPHALPQGHHPPLRNRWKWWLTA